MKAIKMLLAILAIMFLGVGYVSAQEDGGEDVVDVSTPVTIATVEIYDAKIISQNNNQFKISFEIFNEEGNQPGVKYGVFLAKGPEEGQQLIVNERIYDEKVALGPNGTVRKEIEYTAPEFLTGDFTLWVVSQNEKGLSLSQVPVGDIKLNGNSNFLEIIRESCALKIGGQNDKTYTLGQGVDITASENLILTCDIKNNFSFSTTATPTFKTYYRSIFGDPISSDVQSPITLTAGEKKTVEFSMPKASKPQAYDVQVSFRDSKGNDIPSNGVVAHYVLDGLGGIIQNVSLDKSQYKKGEKAHVSFSWSGSADAFPGSRNGGSKLTNASVEFSLTDASGKICAQPFKNKLSELSPDSILSSADIEVTSEECLNPVLTTALKDGDGNIIDQGRFSFNVPSSNEVVGPVQSTQGSNAEGRSLSAKWLTVIGLIPIIVLVVSLFYWRRKNAAAKIGLFLLVIFGSFLWGNQSSAKSFQACTLLDGYYWECAVTFNVGINKHEFYPEEKAIASGAGAFFSCNNNSALLNLTVRMNRITKNLLKQALVAGNSSTSLAKVKMVVQSAPGSYNANFAGTGDFEGRHYVGSVKIPYEVIGANACQGADPVNATLCPGDDQLLPSNTIQKTVTGACTDAKCEYVCNAGYSAYGGVCIANPTLNLSASPNLVDFKKASTLTWSTTNATSCTATGDWNGNKAISGSESTGPLTSPKTYSLECFNEGGISSAKKSGTGISSGKKTVTVGVNCVSDFVYTCHYSGGCSKSTCGDTVIRKASCLRTDNAGCSPATNVPLSKCSSCSDQSISCPACDDKGWSEPAP